MDVDLLFSVELPGIEPRTIFDYNDVDLQRRFVTRPETDSWRPAEMRSCVDAVHTALPALTMMSMTAEDTAAGPCDDETVVVPPPTEGAPQLAWSRDDDSVSDERPHRSWRVALLSAVAVLAVSGCITLVIAIWPRHHAESASQTDVMESTTTPAAALPPITTSTSPASPSPVAASEPSPDERFIAFLRKQRVPFADPSSARADAAAVCSYLDSGHHRASELMQYERVDLWPDLTQDERDDFSGISVGTYCPQYVYLFKPNNDDDHAIS